MRYVSLWNGIPRVSALGLGCAAMMGSASRRDSMAALGAALDAGINFFDTARSYGYGASEGLLGEFCAGRREQVVLCTKFGILPSAPGWKQKLKPMARAAVRLFPSLRKAARASAGQMLIPGQFSVETLRSSLGTSLRELRTEYVDILLMHAAPMSVLAQDDLLEELERYVSAGKVRMAGISGDAEVIAAALTQRPRGIETAQFACNVEQFGFLDEVGGHGDEGLQPKMFLVGNHIYGGAAGVGETRRRIAALRGDAGMPVELRQKLDPADPQLLPELMLNAAMSGTGIGAVVASMLRPEHLRANCRAVTNCRFNAEELGLLRRSLSM